MQTRPNAVIDALHMLLAGMSQILDDLTLVDGDYLLCHTHGRLVQTMLLVQNIVRRLLQLLQLRCERHNNQRRPEEAAAVVLDIDHRPNATLNVAAMLTQIRQINIPTL